MPFATTAAIRAALEAGAGARPAPVRPRRARGASCSSTTTATRAGSTPTTFVDEAIPPGRMPPVDRARRLPHERRRRDGGPSFAARLLERGASVVIASETSVTDGYATRVFARIYGRARRRGRPGRGRRGLRRAAAGAGRASTPRATGASSARPGWASGRSSACSPRRGSLASSIPTRRRGSRRLRPPRIAIGAVTARAVGEFVGRRREQRRCRPSCWRRQRAGSCCTASAGSARPRWPRSSSRRVREREPDARCRCVVGGALTVERGARGDRSAAASPASWSRRRSRRVATRTALELAGRQRRRRGPTGSRCCASTLLDAVPMLVVLDNFEDNLDRPGTGGARPRPGPRRAAGRVARRPRPQPAARHVPATRSRCPTAPSARWRSSRSGRCRPRRRAS